MKRFWQKQLPAFLLTLIMVFSLVPAAMAEEEGEETPGGGDAAVCAHNYVQKTSDTEHWEECTKCGAIINRGNHTKASSEVIKAATCFEKGVTEYTCICGYTWTETDIAATGDHTFNGSDWKSDSTSHWKVCDTQGCTATSARQEHTPRDNGTPHDATCTEDAYTEHVCSTCGAKYTVTVPNTAKGHDVDPQTGICKDCGKKINAVKYTVTFYTLTSSGTYTPSTPQSVEEGKTPNIPSPGLATINGVTYTFSRWVSSNPGTNYTNTSLATANPSKAVTANANYYAVYTAATNTVKVSYYYPSNKLVQQTYTPTGGVPVNGYAKDYAPSISNSFTYNGTTYTFKGWATYASGTKWYLAPNSYIVSNWSTYRVTAAASFYAIYETENDTTITYTVAPGKETSFSTKDFYNVYSNATGGTLRSVTFTAPSSFSKFEGGVSCDGTELTRTELNKYEFYYSKSTYGDYPLSDLSLVADKDADADTVTISYTASGTSSDVNGTLELKVSGSSAKGDITYKVAAGKKVAFDEDDFNDFFQDEYPSYDVRYVTFSTSDTLSTAQGTVYYDYGYSDQKSFTKSTLGSSTFYYGKNTSYGDYALDDLAFVAGSSASDHTVTLKFRAYYNSSRYVDGTLVIQVGDGDSSGGDITYKVAAGKKVDFDEDDFNDFFQEEYSSYDIRYVTFSTSDTLSTAQGTVYYDYNGSDEKSFTKSTIDDYKFYYGKNTSYGDYALDDLTFAAGSSASDHTVTLEFRAYYSSSRYVDGTLVIEVGNGGSTANFTYTVAPGQTVAFKESDFQSVYRKEYSTGTIRWVEFTAPSTLTIAGTVYYDYGLSTQKSFNRSTLNNTKFYYGSSSSYGDYALDDLTFVAASSFSTSVTVEFRAYYSDSKYVDGSLVLAPGTAVGTASGYVGSVRYTTTTGTSVRINANDIARYFKKNTGAALQYVTLTGVPAGGSLYYNYYSTSKYGSASRVQITASNYSAQSFYASPSSTAQYALTELIYVPSGTNYCVSIPFTAYGSSRSLTGTILISVNSAAVSEVYGVTPKNQAVNFPADSISSAVSKASGSTPASIQLLSLPSYTTGAVYVGSTGTTAANTSTAYSIFSGAQTLRFVPATGYTGSVEIPYVALNSSGTAIAVGTFSLGVVTSRKTFTDVKETTWCYKYVAELSDAGVIAGYSNGSFKPDSTVTYGAALKLIMLAAGYPEQAPTSSNVFSGYLAKARAEGIITRSTVDLTKPITRLQMAQIAAGAMKLDTSSLSSVSPFTDTSDASVQALNAAGIVEGYFSNGTSTFKPNNTLTRGQVSAIVWRMRNYNK